MKEFIEKLIEKLEELPTKAITRYKGGAFGDYEGTNYFIDKHKTIDAINELAEEYNNGWIPCSSGYFSTSEVLVCKEDGTIDFDVFDFMCGDWKFNSNHHKNKVIAWQPLPQPYKENENGKI